MGAIHSRSLTATVGTSEEAIEFPEENVVRYLPKQVQLTSANKH